VTSATIDIKMVKLKRISRHKVLRKKAKFANKLKHLVRTILNDEFNIISCKLNNVYTTFFDVTFSNKTRVYRDISDIKEQIVYTVCFKTFLKYEEAKQSIDIIDEPLGCNYYSVFKPHFKSAVNFQHIMNDYFNQHLMHHITKAIEHELNLTFAEHQ
jgi:hypothetical protein